MPNSRDTFDALVVGAGFGGLGAALSLVEQGARVCVCETLRYPGGCASTFTRDGCAFDAGATLMSGLGDTQLFGRWLARHDQPLTVDWLDPVVELRTPLGAIGVRRDRARLVDDFAAMPGAPVGGVRAFFFEQARVAQTLWRLFDDPSLLPPWTPRSFARLARGAFDYAPLLPLLGQTLGARLRAHGVDRFEPLRVFVDALCQITVQCPSHEAEATFALAAMDYYYRGTGHVRGGVGALAWALWRAIEKQGGELRAATRVKSLRRDDRAGVWIATTRRGEVRARALVANVLPSALATLVEGRTPSRSTLALAAEVDRGWGAAMIYATARADPSARPEAHHLQLVADVDAPFAEGNHLFVSIGDARETDRAPAGLRTLTISTHVPLDKTSAPNAAPYVDEVHERMRATLALCAPEWSSSIASSMTASPRTFARFTGRPGGAVGGVPRRAGLHNYRALGPHLAFEDCWLVGDSTFPGQSALATAIGGVRVAAAIARRFGIVGGGDVGPVAR